MISGTGVSWILFFETWGHWVGQCFIIRSDGDGSREREMEGGREEADNIL